MTCRRLNHYWNSSTVKILKERGAWNGPTIKITNAKTKGKDIATHLRFLSDGRKFKSLEWIRTYKLDVSMDGTNNISEQSIPDLLGHCVKLVQVHGQQVVSMDLKYKDLSDTLLIEVLNNPNFEILFTELKEIRFAVARLHHSSPEDPQHLVRTLNSIPNLTRLTLCYTRMFQHQHHKFAADDPCDFYCMALSKLKRLPKLDQLTISLTNLGFWFFKDLAEMSSLKLLRIMVQGEADFFVKIFEFLREKCPSLRELYLIRLGEQESWPQSTQDFPDSEPDWLENTRKLKLEFPNIKVVVDKRF